MIGFTTERAPIGGPGQVGARDPFDPVPRMRLKWSVIAESAEQRVKGPLSLVNLPRLSSPAVPTAAAVS